MNRVAKAAPFVLISTGHGAMIANVNDYRPQTASEPGFAGVGGELIRASLFDPAEVDLALQLLTLRFNHFGMGVIALDCGANIGVHTVEWARHMTGWGKVVAFEAQERMFYALGGNIALSNCFNASALHAAVGGEVGLIEVPALDYAAPASFGSLELRKSATNESIGQRVDYDGGGREPVNLITLDHLQAERVDFIKLDIEGMELEALQGAARTLEAHRPVMMIEHIKAAPGSLQAFLDTAGYRHFDLGYYLIAVHRDDPILGEAESHVRALQNAKV